MVLCFRLALLFLNAIIFFVISKALSPLRRIMAIAPLPDAVDIAQIVSLFNISIAKLT